MVLSAGTPAYEVWKKAEDPVYLKLHLFSVLNPDEVVNNKSKPILKEMGPYVFSEINEKTQIQPLPHNSSVSYKIKRSWFFNPELSNGNLSDVITTINLPVLASQEASRGDYWTSWTLDTTYAMICKYFLFISPHLAKINSF